MAEPVEVAVAQDLARLLGELGRLAGLDVGLAGRARRSPRPSAPAPDRRVDAVERLAGRAASSSRSSASGSPPPADERARHVRPAARAPVARPDVDDHRLARRRSRRSRTRGRRPTARRGRRSRRRAGRSRARRTTAVIASRTVLGGQPGAAARGSASRRRPSPRRRPSARAGCRRAARSRLDAAGGCMKPSASTSSSIPPARRWSATASGNSGGTVARARARARGRRAARPRASPRAGRGPGSSSSSAPSVDGSRTSTPSAATLSASSTLGVADPAAVDLDVEERVADPHRDRMEQVRRRLGGAVDQDAAVIGDHLVQPRQHLGHVAHVVAVVEDRVEVERRRRPRPRAASAAASAVSQACWASRWTTGTRRRAASRPRRARAARAGRTARRR